MRTGHTIDSSLRETCLTEFLSIGSDRQRLLPVSGVEAVFNLNIYKYDQKRQNYLENFGLSVLRFDDYEVKKDIENVLRVISIWVETEH